MTRPGAVAQLRGALTSRLGRAEQWAVERLPAERATQGRAAFRMASAIAPWGFLFSAMFLSFGNLPLAVSLGSAATAAALVGPALRWTRSIRLPIHLFNLGLLQSFLVPSWLLGGIETASVPWLAATTVIATYVAGVVDGFVWVLVGWLGVWGLYAAHVLGWVAPPQLPESATWLLAAAAHSGFVAVVFAASWAVVAVQRRARDDLEAERALAEVASEAKSSFLASMSHELRTPLNAIIGYTELLLEDERFDPQDRTDMQRIGQSGRHLLGLINDVLDLSKVEAGEMVFLVESVAVTPLAQGVLDASAPLLAARGNTARVVGEPDLRALADEARLRQCLLNLVGNAAKFTDDGVVEVTVSGHEGRVRIEVSDTGRGMTPEELGRAFRPFTQANPSIQHTHGGTGLGLALVRDFVRHMNGRVDAKSERGTGSVFTIELPRAPAPGGDIPGSPRTTW